MPRMAANIIAQTLRSRKPPRRSAAMWLRAAALLISCVVLQSAPARADLLVPMDLEQTNHLKAYGLAYHALEGGSNVRWLLNYRGGSFLLPDGEGYEREARALGVGDTTGTVLAGRRTYKRGEPDNGKHSFSQPAAESSIRVDGKDIGGFLRTDRRTRT